MNKIFGAVIFSVVFLSAFISAQSLKIDNFSIKANGETEMISVKKDGKVSVNGNEIGVLQKDGKLKDLNGKTLAKIDKTGKLTDDTKPLGIINKNGEYDNGSGKKIAWTTDGKFNLSESKFLTVSPNKKKFYQSATFLIFLYLHQNQATTESLKASIEDATLAEKFRYQDSDLVARIAKSPGRGGINERDYSIKIFGDGRIVLAGETVYAKQVPLNKKQIQAKLNRFLQKAEELNFLAIYEKTNANPIPHIDDGITISTGVWTNGFYQESDCSAGGCPNEINELHKYFVELFATEMSVRN
jgi:hypothetical protein